MAYCSWPKPVYVTAYIRFRLGRWESVTDHCRLARGPTALATITAQDAHAWFSLAGYVPPAN
jgi:hypothetical protein